MITVIGNAVVSNSLVTKVATTGISIKSNISLAKNNISVNGIIRTGGGGGVYKTVTETKPIHYDAITGKNYIYTSFECAGDPISMYISFEDQDAQFTGDASVAGKQVSFTIDDEVFGLDCTISYLYQVL